MALNFIPSGLPEDHRIDDDERYPEPISYTADPSLLLWQDLKLFFRIWGTIPGIFRPLRLFNGSQWDELWPNYNNIASIVLHTVLVVGQTVFLVTLPLLAIVPAGWAVVYFIGFILVNKLICRIINGKDLVLHPNPDIRFDDDPHDDEYWLFINGVSVGRSWLQSNIDRLSLTFGRRVVGVHNPTDGIVFDLIQCLIQRNLSYITSDIRAASAKLRPRLLSNKFKKVILILHSQGGIEGGMIVDTLLAELPSDALAKLEVYTFGNAANHFNNPKRYDLPGKSQDGSNGASNGSTPASNSDGKKSYARAVTASPNTFGGPANRVHHMNAIRHIEHYANAGDFVAQFGVLNFSSFQTRFLGRVFVNPNGSGHLLNQHYLHTMFPLRENNECASEENDFMETDVQVEEDIREEMQEIIDGSMRTTKMLRETLQKSLIHREDRLGRKIVYVEDCNSPVSPIKRAMSLPFDNQQSSRASPSTPSTTLKVKDFSRLWAYRNGRSPRD